MKPTKTVRESVFAMTKPDLQNELEVAGLDIRGSIPQLRERLIRHRQNAEEQLFGVDEDVEKAMKKVKFEKKPSVPEEKVPVERAPGDLGQDQEREQRVDLPGGQEQNEEPPRHGENREGGEQEPVQEDQAEDMNGGGNEEQDQAAGGGGENDSGEEADEDDEVPQEEEQPAPLPVVPPGGDMIAVMLAMMQQQQQEARRQERERTREARRQERQREQEAQRQERQREQEAQRREEKLIAALRERTVSPPSSTGSVFDARAVQRAVNRLDRGSNEAIEELLGRVFRREQKEIVIENLNNVRKYEDRLIRLQDDKMDVLDGDAQKDAIECQIGRIQESIRNAVVRAEIYIAEIARLEQEEREGGPLPPGILPNNFDGNPVHFAEWWEHFEVLVHTNRKVSTFFKMHYLQKAMIKDAAGTIAYLEPTAANYPKAVEMVKAEYGKPHKVVRHLLHSLIGIQEPNCRDKTSMLKTLEEMKSRLASLENYKPSADTIMLILMEMKLPPTLRQSWERKVSEMVEKKKMTTTKEFLNFFRTEVDAQIARQMNTPEKKSEVKKKEPIFMKREPVTTVTANVNLDAEKECTLCKKNHNLVYCQTFKTKSAEERRKFLEDNRGKVCYGCLDSWSSKHQCRVEKCNSCDARHHELLSCRKKRTDDTKKEASANCTMLISNEGRESLPTVLAEAKAGKKKTMIVRLGLDTFSDNVFITATAAKKLGLKPKSWMKINVLGYGNVRTVEKVGIVEIKLYPRDKSLPPIMLEAYMKEGPICAPLTAMKVNMNQCPHFRDLDFSDPDISEGAEIDILIGQTALVDIVCDRIVRPFTKKGRLPSAWETHFGYAVMGPLPGKAKIADSKSLFVKTEPMPEGQDLSPLWNLESIGIHDDKKMKTPEEKRAEEIFEETTYFEDGRYVVQLPKREDAPQLTNNYEKAKRQLEAQERRLRKNPEKMERYSKVMQEYEELGFARKATPEEIEAFEKGEQYFIPHHNVEKQSSVSTQERVVFNASDEDENGVSLNDVLLPGPALQPDMTQILLRFRIKPIALSGDIKKMFCMTKIDPSQYPLQQYLWRSMDTTIEPTRYIMTSLMFGVSPSPWLACGSVFKHVSREDMTEQYTDVCDEVKKNLYVDDYHGGGKTPEDVIRLQNGLSELFQKGGWLMTKYASNSPEVMRAIPEANRHPHAIIDLDEQKDQEKTTTLGLKWNTRTDEFSINVTERMKQTPPIVTKQIMLSMLNSVYDLFGYAAGFVVTGKILMQKTWCLNVGWTDPLPEEIVRPFSKWADQLKDLEEMPVERYMFKPMEDYDWIEIHGFCDASNEAYGAMIYLRYGKEDEDFAETSFVMAKGRVAPLKPFTTARLELLGALILARLTRYVQEALEMTQSRVHLWSDSEVVLAWLSKPSTTWKTFVRNRVQEIHDLHSPSCWDHVSGEENPADILSRGMTLEELKKSELYWKGPPWLRETGLPWTSVKTKEENSEKIETKEEYLREKEKIPRLVLVTKTDPVGAPEIVQRNEKYIRIKRVLAWILQKLARIRGKQVYSTELTAASLQEAENLLLRNTQSRHFSEEIAAVRENRDLPRRSKLIGLNPIFDEASGILRVGGRLQESDLTEDGRHPIILPDKDELTEKLVMDIHRRNQHSAQETTIALVSQRFSVVHLRQVVRKVVRNCLICKHHRTKPCQQQMGPLPNERSTVAPAFADVGLDFTGPMNIKEGDKVRKSYVCVFTCPRSRMIHLELCLDQTTEEFLQALRRFINRRGWCRTITSDNAKTFKKAKKLLQLTFAQRQWRRMDTRKVEQFLGNNGIEWKYICERSPFRGAYWERLNRSLKEPLKKVLGNALVNYTELMTILTDIEAVLNQRPLAYCGPDPMDPLPVTPAQLALGRNLQELPLISSNEEVSVTKRYKHLQRLLSHFWKRWSTMYLPKMNVRSKWTEKTEEMRVGDVCLITEDNTTRPTWPLGVIIETLPSRDNIVRTVKLKTVKGIVTRPVQRLHLLEKAAIHDNDEEVLAAEDTGDPEAETEANGTDQEPESPEQPDFREDEHSDNTEDEMLIPTQRNQGREDILEPRRSVRNRRPTKPFQIGNSHR